jgi:integrase
MAKAKHKGLYKRGVTWWMRYAGLDGRIRYESTKTTDYKEAQARLIDRKKAVQDGKDPLSTAKMGKQTFKELSVHSLKWCERQRSYPSKVKFMGQLVRVFGNLPLKSFNTRMIEEWQSEKLKINKPATVNRHLEVLKHSFKKAYAWEMVGQETLRRVSCIKLTPENNRRLRYLSIEESKALVNACADHLKPIVTVALHSGMRKDEILSLEWDKHIDLKHGFILLDVTKNGQRREVPVNGVVRETLQGLVRRLDSPYVFIDGEGRRFKEVQRSFTTACKEAVLERCSTCHYERQRTEAKAPGNCPQCGHELRRHKGIEDFTFHDLQHTFASHLVMAGIDITTVKELLGHKTLTMTLRYAHLAPSHKVSAVEVLEKAMTAPSSIQKVYNPQEKGLTHVG